MAFLAARPEKVTSAGAIASALKISESHLAKVLQRLARAGLVKSTRGPNGGFRLDKNPEEIRLMDVYEVVEGPVPQNDCLFGKKVCGNGDCIFHGLLGTVCEMFADHLRNTTLSELTDVFRRENNDL
jgi:Rrf2 family protein